MYDTLLLLLRLRVGAVKYRTSGTSCPARVILASVCCTCQDSGKTNGSSNVDSDEYMKKRSMIVMVDS